MQVILRQRKALIFLGYEYPEKLWGIILMSSDMGFVIKGIQFADEVQNCTKSWQRTPQDEERYTTNKNHIHTNIHKQNTNYTYTHIMKKTKYFESNQVEKCKSKKKIWIALGKWYPFCTNPLTYLQQNISHPVVYPKGNDKVESHFKKIQIYHDIGWSQ